VSGAARMHAAAQGTTLPESQRPKTVGVVPTAAPGEEPEETTTEHAESVKDLASREIKRLLRKAGADVKEKQASVKLAIAYLAVEARIGTPFGGDLDE
jgi:hypothetical protein